MNETFKLFSVIDTGTGKLVSDITNPKHKYWESRKRAEQAVSRYNPNYLTSSFKSHNSIHDPNNLKVVEINCEVNSNLENEK